MLCVKCTLLEASLELAMCNAMTHKGHTICYTFICLIIAEVKPFLVETCPLCLKYIHQDVNIYTKAFINTFHLYISVIFDMSSLSGQI